MTIEFEITQSEGPTSIRRQVCGCIMEYKCSRCGKCYRCKHKLIRFSDGIPMWRNSKGQFEKPIMEKGDWYNSDSTQAST